MRFPAIDFILGSLRFPLPFLRAFAPSRLRVESHGAGRRKMDAVDRRTFAAPICPGQGVFSLLFFGLHSFLETFLDRFSKHGFLFSREGAKARRREAHPQNPPGNLPPFFLPCAS